MNPFMAFCLYVAARVFVQYLKSTPEDQEVRQSLEFLLAAMRAIQRKNPLTESFLVQLNMDIEGSGLDIFLHNPDYSSQYMDGKVSRPSRFTVTLHIMLQRHDLLLTRFQDANHTPADSGTGKSHCSPGMFLSEKSAEGSSPGESLAPHDTRLPKDDLRKESPTLRTEDPRQKTYAYRNADVITRMRSVPPPFFPENPENGHPYVPESDVRNKPDAHTQRFDQIFPSDDWNQGNMATMTSLNAFTDNDKVNAISPSNRHLDTEMADQSSNSRGPTPQSNSSYNPSSSNTSYSPSQGQDDDHNASGSGGGSSFMGFAPPSHDTIFTGAGVKHASQQEDAFKVPAGWDMRTGMTPGSMTDMTADGGWDKLMDSIGWETGKTG